MRKTDGSASWGRSVDGMQDGKRRTEKNGLRRRGSNLSETAFPANPSGPGVAGGKSPARTDVLDTGTIGLDPNRERERRAMNKRNSPRWT